MIRSTSMAQRARRILAIRHLGQAVAAYYDMDAAEVLADAAHFAGEGALIDVPQDLQKPVVDYLCGRLLLPEQPPHSI